ncbi:MAG: Trp biosynthesis-associated membrane protein [Nocardioides sp.]|nr:Trp biosynthesis-associated membrane protein [Nocardioides sp.]
MTERPMTERRMTERPMTGRRWFGPAVVAGVVGSGLCALSGARAWAAPDGRPGSALVNDTGGHVPLAGALGLVALAAWGVLLVTRGRVRRGVAVLGVVVGAGLVATAVVGRSQALDSARHATVDVGKSPAGAHITGWWWVALVASVVTLAAFAIAVRTCGSWPEMGSRYDAPTTPEQDPEPEDMEDVDLWRAIDQGRDPTDPGAH